MVLKIKAVGITEETPILVFQFPFELYPVSILYNSSSTLCASMRSTRTRHTQSLFLIEAAIGKMIGEKTEIGTEREPSISLSTRRDERVLQELANS